MFLAGLSLMSVRCFLTHSAPLCRCLLHSIPGLVLGPAAAIMVELHPQELLYLVLNLHHHSDDKGVCPYKRA